MTPSASVKNGRLFRAIVCSVRIIAPIKIFFSARGVNVYNYAALSGPGHPKNVGFSNASFVVFGSCDKALDRDTPALESHPVERVIEFPSAVAAHPIGPLVESEYSAQTAVVTPKYQIQQADHFLHSCSFSFASVVTGLCKDGSVQQLHISCLAMDLSAAPAPVAG